MTRFAWACWVGVRLVSCRRYYLWELGRYLVLSFSFILGFIAWGDSANWVGDIDPDDDVVPVRGSKRERGREGEEGEICETLLREESRQEREREGGISDRDK